MATIKLKDGIIDRLKRAHGFANDSAFARAIGVSPAALHTAQSGKSSSVRVVAGICLAFGYGPGEIGEAVPTDSDLEERGDDASSIASVHRIGAVA